jgi:N-acetyl-anhydromuramyl-L-alanine amidase AmpD
MSTRFWRVINCIDELNDGHHRERDISRIKTLIIHRVGKDKKYNLSLGDTGPEIAKQFLHNPAVAKYTGGENPYTFIIGKKGEIWQCLPIDEVGNHARRWNVPGCGIACIGDFRYESPTDDQLASLLKLCEVLIRAFGITPWDIDGHTDSGPGATSTPGKQCPGEKLDLDYVRVEVAGDWKPYDDEEDRQRVMAQARRQPHGIVWDGI